LPPRGGEPVPCFVEGIDDTVELAFARVLDREHGRRTVAAERCFDRPNVAGPDQQHPGQPTRHPEHQGKQKAETEAQPVIAWRCLHAHHRPGGEAGDRSGERTAVQQQCLRA
jgi:hypothetical protein